MASGIDDEGGPILFGNALHNSRAPLLHGSDSLYPWVASWDLKSAAILHMDWRGMSLRLSLTASDAIFALLGEALACGRIDRDQRRSLNGPLAQAVSFIGHGRHGNPPSIEIRFPAVRRLEAPEARLAG
jgi:hypothetical protein